MAGKYAQDTTVAPDRSRAEIERTLIRYGATTFAFGATTSKASVQFECQGRRVRFILQMPDPKSSKFTRSQSPRPYGRGL